MRWNVGESTRHDTISTVPRRTVRLWDVRTGGASGVFRTAGDQAGLTAFLPDGQTLISADDNRAVGFWDVRSADAWILRGHRSCVYPVLLSPDGATVYSGGWDGFVVQRDRRVASLTSTTPGAPPSRAR